MLCYLCKRKKENVKAICAVPLNYFDHLKTMLCLKKRKEKKISKTQLLKKDLITNPILL